MTNRTDVLEEGTSRTKGVDALTSNIEAAKAVSQIVKTTLGPMGMDKMLIDSVGSTIVTNDGVKILKEMEVEHPGAKLLVEVAKTQETEVGDGTTTAVILSGELLSQAQELLNKKLHPTQIIKGFKKAESRALEILKNRSIKIDLGKEKAIRDVCETAMTGKVAEYAKDHLSSLIFQAVKNVGQTEDLRKHIKIVKAAGGETSESFFVEGLVLDKKLCHVNMPKKRENAKVLLLDVPLEVRELDSDAKVNINSLDEYQDFLASEREYLKELAFRIQEIGANLIICQKGIDDSLAYFLAKQGISAVRRCRKSDMEKLRLALGVPVVSSVDDVSKEYLGKCGLFEVREILGEDFVFIEKVPKAQAVTLVLKASTGHFLDEIERAVDDSLGNIHSLKKYPALVAGGGAIELEIYKGLEKYAKEFSGKEQIVISSFANSFLTVPKILCENCGFDEIETITGLIALHEKGEKHAGINGDKGIVKDTMREKIVEPVAVKLQAIKSATESSAMILRIDDIIAAKTVRVQDLD